MGLLHRLPKSRLFISAFLTGLGIIVILGFVPFSFPAVKQTIEKRVSELTSGDTLSIQKLSFRLWRGFSLDSIMYATSGQKPNIIKTRIPRVIISYQMIPLLWGTFKVDKIMLRDPLAEIEIRPSPKDKIPEPADSAATPIWLLLDSLSLGLPIKLEVRNLHIDNAGFQITRPGNQQFRGRGLRLDLDASLGDEVRAEGKLDLDSLWAPRPYLFTNLRAEIFLGPNQVKLSNASYKFCRGKGNINITMNTSSDTLLAADFSLKDLDLA
ncbi:hypothetical protein ACFL5V_13910, partial [Fibrobacterota bacterium]